jgi:ribonuclease J
VCSRQDDPALHVSGHAARDEQARMIELTQPRSFIPVHGSYVHLTRHAALARSLGVEDTLVIENGAVVRVDPEGMEVEGAVDVGRVHLQAGEEIEAAVLRERERLSAGGIVLVHLRMDGHGRAADALHVTARGVVDDTTFADLKLSSRTHSEIARALKSFGKRPSREDLEQAVVRATRKVFRDTLGFRPVVHAVVDIADR